jgi:SOS-response transcriptional repressor LexA
MLQAIAKLTHEKGYAPSHRELAEAVGLSLSGVHYYLNKMHDAQQISFTPKTARSLRLTGAGQARLQELENLQA